VSSEPSSSLFVVGASHQTTPLELREKLALTAEKLESFRALAATVAGLRELAILNTCNRVELYGVATSPEAVESLRTGFCQLSGLPPATFDQISRAASGREAIVHLIQVASGLESQMLGENEIFGQVKDAYEEAQRRRTVGSVLNRVFQKAFQGAKQVRSQTGLSAGQVSIANVAVELAVSIFGDLSSIRVLLLGAGDIGEKTAKAFQSRGSRAVTVASRTLSRAMELATEFGAVAMPFEQLAQRLPEFDIVVCSTAAPHAVVTHAAVSAALRHRPSQPLFFIDLALPRDVEPNVASLDNAFVYNLDDLARIAERNRAAREAEVAKARSIIQQRADAIWTSVASQVGALPPSPAPAPPSVVTSRSA
jgi:glutamyl-tRNA reductase